MGTCGKAWIKVSDSEAFSMMSWSSGNPEGFGAALLGTSPRMETASLASMAFGGEPFVALREDLPGVAPWDKCAASWIKEALSEAGLEPGWVQEAQDAAARNDREALAGSPLLGPAAQKALWGYAMCESSRMPAQSALDEFRLSSWHVGSKARRGLCASGVESLEGAEAADRILDALEKNPALCRASNDFYWDGEAFRSMFWVFESQRQNEWGEPAAMFEAPLITALALAGDWGAGAGDPLRSVGRYLVSGLGARDRANLLSADERAKEKGWDGKLFGGLLDGELAAHRAYAESLALDKAAGLGLPLRRKAF